MKAGTLAKIRNKGRSELAYTQIEQKMMLAHAIL
jgi:hypothetical protein